MKIPLKRAVVREPVLACGVGGKYLDTDKIKGLHLTYLPHAQCVLVEREGYPSTAFHAGCLRNFIPVDPEALLLNGPPPAAPQSPKKVTRKTTPRPRKPTPPFSPPGSAS